ncbi:MAG: hypothetical protein IJ737_03745 [Ruminococcus sp.]|nr:hypothetical protein [Ruminococcus sp.]
MICPFCNKTINDGDLFCAYCRSRLDGQQPAQQMPQPMQQPFQSGSYQQPSPPPPSYPAYPQTPPPRGKNLGAILAIIILGVMLLGAAVLLFIYPGYLVRKGGSDKKDKSDISVSAADGNDSGSGTVTTTVTSGSLPPVSSEQPAETSGQTETTTTTTAPPETTTAPETTTTTTAATKSPQEIAKEEAMQYSTDEKPSFEDFEWCYGQFGLIRDPSETGEALTEPYSWTGGWKCLIIDTPEGSADSYIRELCSVDIFINGGTASLTIQHYIYEIDGESFDDSITADFGFSGTASAGRIDATGSGRISIDYFWREGGHEYAVGDLILQDGTDAYIALYR